MNIGRLFHYHRVALFGDNKEIACISHKGYWPELGPRLDTR
jgi:hypothetical protein